MNKFLLYSFSVLALSVGLLPNSGNAAPLCSAQSLSGYLADGFECEVNTAIFRDFSFSSTDSATTEALDADAITVTPLEVGGRVGLRFSGAFQNSGLPNGPGPAAGLTALQYRFFFEVTRPGWLFTDAVVTLNEPSRFSPNPLKFGGVLSAKSIANDGATAIVNDQDPDLTATGALFTPRETIRIDELLQLSGGASAEGTDAPVGTVSLRSADNLFGYEAAVVPEPGTWGLLAAGGAFLAVAARRRKLQ